MPVPKASKAAFSAAVWAANGVPFRAPLKPELPADAHEIVSPAKFVIVVLVCYFAFVLYKANNKLRSGQVGTIFMKKSEKTVKVS